MSQLLLMTGFLIAGFIARHSGLSKPGHAIKLNTLIIFIPLPAIVLLKIPSLEFNAGLVLPVITPWLLMIPVTLLVIALKKYLGLDRKTFSCLLICCTLGNTAYLGYPMSSLLLGEDALPTAIIYDQLGNFMLLAVVTSVVISWNDNNGKRHPVIASINKVLRFPPFLCLLVALLLPADFFGTNAKNMLRLLGLTLMPLAMISIGLQLDIKPARDLLAPLIAGLSIKMLATPIILYCVLLGFGPLDLERKTMVLQSAMPSSVAAGALAMGAGLAPRLCAAMVAYGMVFSLAILPAWASILS